LQGLEFRSNNTERQPVRHVYECNPCRAKVAAALEAPPPVPPVEMDLRPVDLAAERKLVDATVISLIAAD